MLLYLESVGCGFVLEGPLVDDLFLHPCRLQGENAEVHRYSISPQSLQRFHPAYSSRDIMKTLVGHSIL